MRAFISKSEARQLVEDPSFERTPTQEAALWQQSYLEAKRILAMVEPRTSESDYYELNIPWPDGLPRPILPAMRDAYECIRVNVAATTMREYALLRCEAAILAESLTAFVNS